MTAEEGVIGTDPNDADSDDDGVLDGAEANYTDDTDGDGNPYALANPICLRPTGISQLRAANAYTHRHSDVHTDNDADTHLDAHSDGDRHLFARVKPVGRPTGHLQCRSATHLRLEQRHRERDGERRNGAVYLFVEHTRHHADRLELRRRNLHRNGHRHCRMHRHLFGHPDPNRRTDC